MVQIDGTYIHDDKILSGIYFDAVKKFMKKAENEIVFNDLCNYVYKKLVQKKQDVYSHSLHIVKEVCQKIGEDFYNGVDFYAPNSKNYQDIYFELF